MRFRIGVREQLCILIAVTSSLALMILAVSTWEQSHHFITRVRSSTLEVTANLKANQIAQDLDLYRDLVQAVSTRTAVQTKLGQYNNGNLSESLLEDLGKELHDALSGGAEDKILLQAAVFPRSDRTDQGGYAISNATGEGAIGTVVLPGTYQNGSRILLGDPDGSGYPSQLYPNFTWSDETENVTHISYGGRRLYHDTTLMLGPLYLGADSATSALISMTVAINNNTSRTDILGWLTVVLDARILYDVASAAAGLGRTGEIVVASPVPADNLFLQPVRNRPATENADILVNFILPPASNKTLDFRHAIRNKEPSLPFPMRSYPCVLDVWSNVNGIDKYTGSQISTYNEESKHISCGYAMVPSPMVDWAVILEQSYSEVVAPIRRLRNIILACVFSVLGAIIIICLPIAHCAVKPVLALRSATENSIMTYEAETLKETASSQSDPESLIHLDQNNTNEFIFTEKKSRKRSKPLPRRQFQIPQKVPDRRHIIQDELSDLIGTFNEMSDELKVQYERLEDRVRQRTRELEKSRDLARAANESKTLFIANVSHELRTPLNGIIGMCAVAMQEDEVHRIRQSLNIIYKSSDLLFHLLNDLLTFSRNSYGQQLSIEEGVFRLEDIGTQIVSIFEKQARESNIGLKVVFLGSNDPRQDFDNAPEDAIYAKKDIASMLKRVRTNVLARGPADTGPLRQMCLRGDKNRILQVLMNLVSNSLKFTPAHGMIEVRIRCEGFGEPHEAANVDVEARASTAVPSLPIQPQVPGTAQSSSGRRLDFDFEVEDTGSGVPDHLHDEIFKPFVQGDLGLSRKHGGTGLGLAICAQLASLMGGGIHLKSTVDIGSTFTFSLPLVYTKEKVPSVAGSLGPGSRKGSLHAPSIGSSVRMEALPTKSVRPPYRGPRSSGNKTQPTSVKESIYSGSEEMQPMDQPRIVGFSQPYITDTVDNSENGRREQPNADMTAGQRANANKNRLESIASVPQDVADTNDFATCATNGTGESPATASPPPKPPSMKVLVAEDNKVNQEVIKRMLKLENMTDVEIAEDGQLALNAIRDSMGKAPDGTKTSPYQLVFMDIQMPNMDGIESTKHIKELGFNGPIVALTAFDHETNREACKAAGMIDFLPKPLKRTALKKILQQFRPVVQCENYQDV